MRKVMKRVLTLTCAAAIAVSAAGCSGSNKTEQINNKQNSTKAEQEQPMVKWQLYKNFGAPGYPADGGEGKKAMLEGLEKIGVKNVDFNVTLTSGTEYFSKLNLLAASGTLPDVFSINEETLNRFADQGLLLKIDPYIEKSPNIMKYTKKEDWETLRINGSIYSYTAGFRPEAFNGPTTSCFVARKDWMDKLGLKEPETLDEFYNLLVAFTNNDPDGNGKKDTFGLSGNKDIVFEAISGAFGVNSSSWYERNGVLKKGCTLPEMKEALAVLQKWYKEGLIDPDFPVTEGKASTEKFLNSKAGILNETIFIFAPTHATHTALIKANPQAKLTVILPPKGPKGLSGIRTGQSAFYPGAAFAVSAKAQSPDLLFKMLDWMANDDDGGGYWATLGVAGKDYVFDKQNNKVTMNTSDTDLYNRGLSNTIQFFKMVDRRYLDDYSKEVANKVNTRVIPSMFNKTLPVMNDYPDLNNLFQEYYVKIIVGSLPLDAFDEFVKKYYEKGGKQIEDAVNAEYKKMKK